MNKFCSECGAQLPEEAKFCSECGAVVSSGRGQSKVIASKQSKTAKEQVSQPAPAAQPGRKLGKNQYMLLLTVGFGALLVAILYHYYGFVKTVEQKAQQTTQQSSAPARAQAPQEDAHQHAPPSQEEIDAALQAVKANPNDADSNTKAGNILFDAGRFKDAIPYYQKSLKIKPANPDVLVDLGVCYFNLEDYLQAKEYFSKALEHNPDHVNALYNAGVVAVQVGDMSGLINYWTHLQQVAPTSTQAQRATQILEQIHQNAQQQPGS